MMRLLLHKCYVSLVPLSLPPLPIHVLVAPNALAAPTGTVLATGGAGVANTSANGFPSCSRSSDALDEAADAC